MFDKLFLFITHESIVYYQTGSKALSTCGLSEHHCTFNYVMKKQHKNGAAK